MWGQKRRLPCDTKRDLRRIPHTGAHLRTLTGHEAGVWSMAFSPDGMTIATTTIATTTGSQDQTVRLWRTSDGMCGCGPRGRRTGPRYRTPLHIPAGGLGTGPTACRKGAHTAPHPFAWAPDGVRP